MALAFLPSAPISTLTRLSHRTTTNSVGRFSQSTQCMTATAPKLDGTAVTIADKPQPPPPPTLEDSYIQSITSKYVGETWTRRAGKLKEEVRRMIHKVEGPMINKLELIETLQRLGLSYHFEAEIKTILDSIYNNNHREDGLMNKDDLYATALEFRLLREHGYYVPQDVFNNFKDEFGNFKTCLRDDVKGLLYLYEASYLSTMGENILDEAQNFTHEYLKESLKNYKIDSNLAKLIIHSLEVPFHWRMPRLEARWFINVYEMRQDMNTTLLELAKLDFNIVQGIHLEDLKHMSRWWKSTCLGDKLSFARDNLVENFYWSVGVIYEPQFQYSRRIITQLASLITIIDDIYDQYGTLQQLEIFTNAVERWDVIAVEELPCDMKLGFLAVYNSTNEMASVFLNQQDSNVISYLKNAWADLCKCYLVEAKWCYNKYTPNFEEYMKNAWISVGGALVLVHSYFSLTNPINKEALDSLEKYHNIIRCSSMIVRLSNDLGPSNKDELTIGDNLKSIKCYIHETGGSESDARKHINKLMRENWKSMNEDLILNNSPFNQIFVRASMNLARMSLVTYQHGNGHGMTDIDLNRVISLLINPIPFC
ncbi:hypothetical protein LguiB_033560 [Lonicera macranthoides]